MSNVIPFPKKARPQPWVAYEGNCPACGLTSRILNIAKSHWGYCAEHKTKWYVGENLYSRWRDESPADWRRNDRLLFTCVEVEPVYSPDGPGAAA